jgi:electron transfer flavoprotein alpha subunit
MSNILVFIEHQNNKVKKTSFELISKANELKSSLNGTVNAVIIGDGVSSLADQIAPYGVDSVLTIENASLAKYNCIAYAEAIAKAVSEASATVVLGTASPLGKELFPRLASKLKAGLASDCTDLKADGGQLLATKPVYAGKAIVDVEFHSDIKLVTTRPNSFPISAPNEGASTETKSVDYTPENLRAEISEIIQGEEGKVDLTEAEIIVSGGRAMGNSENFSVLRELASVIGASVGASRAAVDSGYAPHDMQVGQTGKVVNPKLYMACGISGAIQHLAGMRNSKVIVAINKDPEAPIFSKADYGIVGDLFTLVPLITEEFKQSLAE